MPCPKCGSMLVLLNDKITCPECEGIKFLDKEPTIAMLERNMKEVDQQIMSHLKERGTKTKILLEIAWQRELFSRNFFSRYQTLGLSEFASYNLLLFRIMSEPNFSSKNVTNYRSEVKDLVNGYQLYIQMKSKFLLLREGFADAIQHGDKVDVVPNEKYFPILSTYEDNDIMEKSKAEEKRREYQQTYEDFIRTHRLEPTLYSPEQFISKFYPLINQLYSGLLRNEVYSEVFGLLDNFNAKLAPGAIMDLVNTYFMYHEFLTHASLSDFLEKAIHHFKLSEKEVKDMLLFSESNQRIFPLFIFYNGRVYISHRTSFLLYVLMHALLYKDLFNKETEKRSKEFENQQVKEAFEKIDWKYICNIKDKKKPSLQIDGIASIEDSLIVVECKGWQLYPFYEYQSKQSYLERDIKGIVDGQKFTGGQPAPIPSLLEKVEFVKSNLPKLGFNPTLINSVQGLIVMRSFPPITEYKGIQVFSVKDIPKQFAKQMQI